MSSGSTLAQISKRSFMRLLTIAASPAALFLPSLARAQQPAAQAQQQGPGVGPRIPSLPEAAKMVESNQNLGLLIMLGYDGQMKAQAVNGRKYQEWDKGQEPPVTGEILGQGTIDIVIYRSSPGCVRCTHGGKVMEVCD